MPQRVLRLTAAALLGLTLVLYTGHTLVYFRYAAALIQFPFDSDQGEGFELNDAVLFARGEWPYRSNEVYPFYASNYPPLYHLWLVPFVWVFGPAYWYGRLFSFLSTLGTAGAIGFAVHRVTCDKPISLISGLAYLASNYVYHIGPLFRQHISMVMFETLAIVILAPLSRDDTPTERKRIFFGLLCLLAAGYTKQLAYATVAVCLLFVILRGVRRGIIATALFVAVAGAIFGLINLATGGQWWLNIILANINEFIPGQMEGLYRQWYDLHIVLIWLSILLAVLVIAALVISIFRLEVSGTHFEPFVDNNALYAMWLVAAIANGSLAGKWGAGESYFMTSIAAMCICAGILLGEWRRLAAEWRVPFQWATAIAIPFLLISQATRLIHMPTQGLLFGVAWRAIYSTARLFPAYEPFGRVLRADPNLRYDELRERHFGVVGDVGVFVDSEGVLQYFDSQGYTQLGRPPNQIDIEQGYRILAHTRAADGPVLTEEAAFSLLAGKEQVGNPTQLLNLAKNSMLDSTAMVKMIEDRAFDVIVLKAEFYPRPVLLAIGQNYVSVETIAMNGFDYRVLKPKEESSDAP